MLATRHLDIGYGRRRVLAGLDLELAPGELTVLIGANGSGKSTLLRTLSGAQPPLGGRVLIDGTDVAALTVADRARLMAVVLTDRTGGGGLRVDELVAIGRHRYSGFFGALRPDDRRAVADALVMVGLEHKSAAMVASLSDGERQKAMIARAVAQASPLIVLDEPTSFLDVSARFEVMALLRRLCRECGRTVLMSTHDTAAALDAADRIWAVAMRVEVPEADTAASAGVVFSDTVDGLAAAGVLDTVYPGVRFDPARRDFVAR